MTLAPFFDAHALVAGGALSDTGEWISPKKGFLFPVRALSKVFRGKFVTGLDGLRRQGRLPDHLYRSGLATAQATLVCP